MLGVSAPQDCEKQQQEIRKATHPPYWGLQGWGYVEFHTPWQAVLDAGIGDITYVFWNNLLLWYPLDAVNLPLASGWGI